MKSLEAELGVVLLQRTSRSMALTDEGRLVYDYSRRVGGDIGELLERLEESRGEVRGRLKISSLVHVGRHIVQPAITAYLAQYSRTRVDLTLDDGPLRFTRDGFDLAVRVGRDVEGSLSARKLVDNNVCLAASPSFVEKHGLPTSPSELPRFPAVAYASKAVEITVWTYVEEGVYKTVEVHPVYRVNEGNALLDAVRAGVGIGYLSTFAAREDLVAGTICRVLPELELPPYDPVYMIQARSEYRSPRLEAFRRHLRTVAKSITA